MRSDSNLKSKYLYRLLAILLCVVMVFSMFVTSIISLTHASESLEPLDYSEPSDYSEPAEVDTPNTPHEETIEEIKARLLWQVTYLGWDPYSADMTLDEFYALMELFQEGILPLEEQKPEEYSNVTSPSFTDPVFDEPMIEESGMGISELVSNEYENEDGSGTDEPGVDEPVGGESDEGEPGEGGSNESDPGGEDSGDGGSDPDPTDPTDPDPTDPTDPDPTDPTDPDPTEPTDPTEPSVVVPKSMFLFSGLDNSVNLDDYDNENGNPPHYQPGLDEYGSGYKIPSAEDDWPGVVVSLDSTGKLQTAVIVKGANASDPTIAGDVDQRLFVQYDSYYVRRVTAKGVDISVLGVVQKALDEYVYYYLSTEDQDTTVSSTTLKEGEKFIVQYAHSEYPVEYKVELNDGTDVTNGFVDSIFGANRLNGTVDRQLNFDATGPYLYKTEIYVETSGGTRTRVEGVSSGEWALGTEPVYTLVSDFSLAPDLSKGPAATMFSDTFHIIPTERSTIVAVLTSKGDPVFDAATLVTNPNAKGAYGRGTSATLTVRARDKETNVTKDYPYDYEDEYLYRKGLNSKYDSYPNNAYWNGNACNIFPSTNAWNWNNKDGSNYHAMKPEADGSYSCQWTFQTNTPSDNFLMDTLAINGVAVPTPFFPKYKPNDNYNAVLGTDGGTTTYVNEVTLPDGAVAKVEFLMVFGSTQRVYRISVTGAHSNVTISALNLNMGSGADEFAVNNLVGVHADDASGGEQLGAIQYFHGISGWKKEVLGNVVINQGGYIDFENGDKDNYGANIRFKLKDGYASPYYFWEESDSGNVILDDNGNPQASATRAADASVASQNDIMTLPDDPSEKLNSQFIYGPDVDGWYYIRVASQQGFHIANLTIVARPIKYVLHYVPGMIPEYIYTDSEGNKFTIEPHAPANMPTFKHYPGICHPSFFDPNYNIPGEEYDDKDNEYYDVQTNHEIVVSSVQPADPRGYYRFVDWVLVDINNNPITRLVFDENGNPVYKTDETGEVILDEYGQPIQLTTEIHYTGNSTIEVNDINEYAILNGELGGADTDVDVIRIMPTWERVNNPFRYKVALNWVDAQGNITEKFFDGYWSDVITDWVPDGNNGLTVQIHPDAEPLRNWIAQNPTYTFWDAVNNNNALYQYYQEHPGAPEEEARAAMIAEMEIAISQYLPELVANGNKTQYDAVLKALSRRDISGNPIEGQEIPADGIGNGIDDFWRLGGYAFQVFEDGGTIVLWMYEDKGGLVFREEVRKEPLVYDDEFYYTITNVVVGDSGSSLNGTYKAYPEFVYDKAGNERPKLDSDAWLVKFVDGEVVSIIKNDGSIPPETPPTYFTLKDGEGIMLYVPNGQYTITELGSRSGGTYKTGVTYDGKDGREGNDGWDLPGYDDLWLSGNKAEFLPEDDTISQVSATVKFEVGNKHVVHTLIFANETTSLSIEKQLGNVDRMPAYELAKYQNTEFTFEVDLMDMTGYPPLEDNNEHYFIMHVYNTSDNSLVREDKIILESATRDGDDVWRGRITLKSGQRAVIVMTVPHPEEGRNIINYWVKEVDVPSPFTPDWHGTDEGTAKPGELAKAVVCNMFPDTFLAITETGGKKGESFLYVITNVDTGKTLTVSVTIGENGIGKTIVECPAGTYTVEEITSWAWRYSDGTCTYPTAGRIAKVSVIAENCKGNPARADFMNKRNSKWLGGEGSRNNHFAFTPPPSPPEPEEPTEPEEGPVDE